MNGSSSQVRTYESARSDIRDCDVLLYRGRGAISALVRFFTRSPYSHAGLAAWWNDRLMVMEAVGRGVMITPLSVNVARYDGGVEWFQYTEDIPGPDRLEMVRFAQEQLGKEFARWKMFSIVFYIIFQWKKDRRDILCRAKKLFCSYYVAQVYNRVKRDLKKNASDRFMSPGDIADSPYLRKMAVLKKEEKEATLEPIPAADADCISPAPQ